MNTTPLNQTLKNIISVQKITTQSEIKEQLQRQGINVDQSTVSRMLRRLGVMKVPDSEGRLVYRWPPKKVAVPATRTRSMTALVKAIVVNESLILLHTDPGSAGLVARFLDVQRPEGLLGTLAGDDTVLVVPASQSQVPALVATIRESFQIART